MDEEHKIVLDAICDRIGDTNTILQTITEGMVGVLEKLNEISTTALQSEAALTRIEASLLITNERLMRMNILLIAAENKNREIVIALCEIGKLLGKDLIKQEDLEEKAAAVQAANDAIPVLPPQPLPSFEESTGRDEPAKESIYGGPEPEKPKSPYQAMNG